MTAYRAYDFLNSLGVNTHLNYSDGGYYNIQNVITDLQYLGIWNVRDTIGDGIGGQGQIAHYYQLAGLGAQFCICICSGGTQTTATLNSQIALVSELNTNSTQANCVFAVEGPNEINNFPLTFNGVAGQQGAVNLQQQIYSTVYATSSLTGVKVSYFTGYGFDPTYMGIGGIQGPNPATMPGYADFDTQHPYPNGGSSPLIYINRTQALPNETPPTGPALYTETGYSTAVGYPPPIGYVNESVQAKYILSLFLDAFSIGITRTYIYQLMDAYNTGSPQGNDGFGLFEEPSVGNTVPKMAGTAIHNLTTILSDTGSTAKTFTPATIPYSISGLPSTGNSLLFQKSDGSYWLAIWAEPPLWDSATESPLTASPTSIAVSFGGGPSYTANVYDPLVGISPTTTVQSVTSINLSLVDHAIVINLAISANNNQLTSPPPSFNLAGTTVPGTLTVFTPTTVSLFTFQATLDGALYTCVVTWNVYRADWYLNIYDQNNTLILSRPLVGSPPLPETGINLVSPWFKTSTMYFYEALQTFAVYP